MTYYLLLASHLQLVMAQTARRQQHLANKRGGGNHRHVPSWAQWMAPSSSSSRNPPFGTSATADFAAAATAGKRRRTQTQSSRNDNTSHTGSNLRSTSKKDDEEDEDIDCGSIDRSHKDSNDDKDNHAGDGTVAADDDDYDDSDNNVAHVEDAYLRTQAYHSMARHMEDALTRALDETTALVRSEFHRLLRRVEEGGGGGEGQNHSNTPATMKAADHQCGGDQAVAAAAAETDDGNKLESPTRSNDNIPKNPDRVNEVEGSDREAHDQFSSLFTIEPTIISRSIAACSPAAAASGADGGLERYHPRRLLPVLLLDGPFWPDDREMLFQHLVKRQQQRDEDGTRSCTVWLRTSSSSSKNSLQHELVRQCLQQEPDGKMFSGWNKNKKKRLWRGISSDLLLHWASQTCSFDRIVVFVTIESSGNDDLLYNTPMLSDFLHWTAQQRAEHGIPISIVLQNAPSFRRELPLVRGCCDGHVLVRRATLPSAQDILDAFWQNLYTPMAFQTLDIIRCAFQHQHRSFLQVIRQLQQEVALALGTPGSFLAFVPMLARAHSRRIASLILDKRFCTVIVQQPATSNVLEWMVHRESLREIVTVAQDLLAELIRKSSTVRSSNLVPFFLAQATVSGKTIGNEERKELVSILARHRSRICSNLTTSFSHLDLLSGAKDLRERAIRDSCVQAINELIVLVENCKSTTDVQHCLLPVLEEWLTSSLSPLNQQRPSGGVAFDEKVTTLPQPRRDHVRGMLEAIVDDNLDNDDNTHNNKGKDRSVYIPAYMYRTLLDQATITESEWFDSFLESYPTTESDMTTLFHLFACGVRHLQIAGLIRKRKVVGRNDEYMYEKSALVWCGGD
jgi:hypothetical protein